MRLMSSILFLTFLVTASNPARADDPPPLEADAKVDGGVILGTAAVTLGLALIHVNDSPDPWDRELFGPLDRRVRGRYSARARALSNVGVVTAVALPAGLAIGTDWDEAAGDRALVFGESVAGALLVATLFKTAIGRPRPYTYSSDDPDAIEHTRVRGRDSRRSFPSAHAATAFAAATAAGMLYAGRDPDKSNRALVWAAGATVAAATANWRVRAGEHFYSDIVVGGLVGIAAGTIVPSIHTGKLYRPSGTEWAALAGGVLLGSMLSELVPLNDKEGGPAPLRAQLTPLVLPSGGGGLGVVGTF